MSAVAADARVLDDFHGRFRRLGPHPDKAVIDDCVRFAKEKSGQAYHIAKAMVSRYMDPKKDVRCLLSILYCMDAIMLYAAGEYPAIFSRYMIDVCLRGFDCMDYHGRTKLGNLIQIWEERNLYSSELINQLKKMKEDKLAQPASTPSFQAPRGPPAPAQQPLNAAYPHNLAQLQQRQQQSIPQAPQLHVPGMAPRPSYESLLSTEKEALLNELLQSLGEVPGAMTLDQLAQSNIELYSNICASAEANASFKFSGGATMPPHMLPSAQAQAQAPAVAGAVASTVRIPTPTMVMDVGNGKAEEARTADTFLSRWSEEEHHASASDGDGYLLGFVGTNPVLIQTEGVEAVCGRLEACEEALGKLQETGGVKQEDDDGAGGLGSVSLPSSIISTRDGRASVSTALAHVKRKLGDILAEASSPSPALGLPSLVTGPLPLQPSPQYSRLLEEYLSTGAGGARDGSGVAGTAAMGPKAGAGGRGGAGGSRAGVSRFSARKAVTPAFQTEQLKVPAAYALQGLYVQRKYQFQEDGVRFLTQATLDAYVDKYARKQLHRNITANTIKHRPWLPSEREWQADFGESVNSARDQVLAEAAGRGDEGGIGSGSGGALKPAGSSSSSFARGGAGSGADSGALRDYSVLADEQFPRCPISRERFVSTFDEDSGEMWYKNAARVLVTSLADVDVYNLAKDTKNPKVRYLVVNKVLVLDNWLENGKAACYSDAKQRYEAMGAEHEEKVMDLQTALAGEEDDEDCFVMLELS